MSIRNSRKAYTVLVTGIGGNVGQGIIKNIRTEYPEIEIVGTNVTDFSAGNHLCDYFYKIPYAYEEGYISCILNILKEQKIDLIIPSTDFEVYHLALNKKKISCALAVSSIDTCSTYIDKYKSFLHHKQYDIPFAFSYLPSQYDFSFKECIAKPRTGRGSRGLLINPSSLNGLRDEDYMVQELIRGQEITTAFYVNESGLLHGHITFERNLVNGTTSECKVVFTYDEQLEVILKKIIKHSEVLGAANLQSIVNSDGNIIPFEINCRISGTNSIRSNFGFKDVKYTIQEYLLDEKPNIPNIKKGVATRILMDVIYPESESYNEVSTNNSNYYIF